ncbi:MAG: choline ABC transporter permease subunit [Gammaproteobacteria bacterium]
MSLSDYKLPLGKAAESVIDFLTGNAAGLFDGIAYCLQAFVDALLYVLQTPPPLAVICIATLATHLAHRRLKLTLFVAAGLLLIINLGYWKETTHTLSLVLASGAICMAAGVPLGIAAAHHPKLYVMLRPLLDLMQTIPTFVYLIPALILFGLGEVPGLIATVIFAIAAPVRLTHLGISSVPPPLLEAGRAFGCSRRQLLVQVELPYALPQIMAGFTQTIMLSLSMVVIAAMVGAPGLGTLILRAINQVDVAKGFEAGFAIVIIAIILDRVLRVPQKA